MNKTNSANQLSIPQIPPKLQPGRSSLYWADQTLKLIIALFIAIAVLMMIIYLLPVDNPIRFPLMLMMLAVGCAIAAKQ